MNKQINKIPKVRFPEFKEEWEHKQLGNIIYKTDKKNKQNLDLPVYSINNTEGFLPQAEQFEGRSSSERGFDISIYKIIQENTFAYNPARINVGSIGYSYNLKNILISSLYVCFKTNEELNDTFLLQFLETVNFKTSVLRYQEGGVRQYLFFDSISKIKTNIPILKEQKKIAHFFTTLDKKINQLQQQKSSLEAYKKGMMQQLFSQELRFKDENGQDFDDWEEKKLGEVLSIGSGKDYKHLQIGEIPVYGSGGYMTSVNKYLFNGESVCIGRKGTIDKPLYLNEKFWTVDTLFYTHTFIKILPKFVYYIFLVINWKKFNEAGGVPSLSKRIIENISINIASLPEQTKIANFLSKIDNKINVVSEQIEETKQYKKALLQRMFVN